MDSDQGSAMALLMLYALWAAIPNWLSGNGYLQGDFGHFIKTIGNN
jgi:hypothetical protein